MTLREYKLSNQRGRGRGLQWIMDHVGYQRGDCLRWPFGRDSHGYGQLGINRKVLKAHRVMCEMAHGPAPGDGYEASHSCGRGHQGCTNPNHLSWKTRSENQRDRLVHGTDGAGNKGVGRCKLTPADVIQIKRLVGVETNISIARQFGVTPSLIIKIKKGELWSGVA